MLLTLLSACDFLGSPRPEKSSSLAVAGCDPNRIEFFAARYRAQLVFDACGINNFRFFRWSPDGKQLFFQTGSGPFVLDGETKAIRVLPISSPTDTPLWMSNKLLAFGHVPKDDKKHRIDFYNLKSTVWNQHPLTGYRNPRQLAPSEKPGKLYFVADTDDARGRVYELSLDEDGKISRAFEWMPGPVRTFSYLPSADLATWSVEGGGEVLLSRGSDGKKLAAFSGAKRATVSSDGRWVLVEETGDRRLESARKGRSSIVPDIPPRRLYLWDVDEKRRVEFPGIRGFRAEWYPDAPHVSLILQGFDEHLYNPNVLLVNVEMLLRDQKLRSTTD